MQIIGDRHYKRDPGEQITFSAGPDNQLGSIGVTCTCNPGTTLPIIAGGSGHCTVTVTAGFTGSDGGSVDVIVTGSARGTDTSKIRQLTTLPFRSGIFSID